MPQQLIEIKNLSKAFPGVQALDSVSLNVASGEIVALVGQNGSGKSTLVKVLAGVYRPDPGSEVELATVEGREVGLHFIHQDLGLIETLSTIENLDLGQEHGRGIVMPANMRAEQARAEELIATFGGNFDVRANVENLTAAERTLVAIARALDGWEHPANVLVLDEPTASLHGDEVQKLFTAVRRVAEQGAAVIFISHRLDEVIELADRVAALRDGKLIADVERGKFDYDDLVEMIAGSVTSAHPEAVHREVGEPVMRAIGITGPTIAGLDIEIHAEEIVGISGVLGSGREEVASVLFGASPGEVASLEVGGKSISRVDPRGAVDAGVAYVPADRRGQGAVMTMSLRENVTLPRLGPLRRFLGRLDRREERRDVGRWIDRVNVRPAEPERELELFSGGNQQKVVLAKWLRNEPKVLLLDEPTQGVDVGAKAGIYELIANAAGAGAGILVASSDEKELVLICDRVLVMRDGRLAGEVMRQDLTESALIRANLTTRGGVGPPSGDLMNGGMRTDA